MLKRGSQINGLTLALWDESQQQSSSTVNFRYAFFSVSFAFTYFPRRDPDGQPPLFAEQHRVSTVWRRAAPMSNGASGARKLLPQEILQHVVTDCSVCASISVCLEHARRFDSGVRLSSLPTFLLAQVVMLWNTQLAHSALHSACGVDVSLEDKTAALSLTGDSSTEESRRYDVKMFVSGAWRRVCSSSLLGNLEADSLVR